MPRTVQLYEIQVAARFVVNDGRRLTQVEPITCNIANAELEPQVFLNLYAALAGKMNEIQQQLNAQDAEQGKGPEKPAEAVTSSDGQ